MKLRNFLQGSICLNMERLRQSCVYWNIDREQRVQKLFHFYDRGVVDQKVDSIIENVSKVKTI